MGTAAAPPEPAAPPRNNEAAAVCAACGGECCFTRPGIEAPDRFVAAPDPAAALGEALASGDWVLVEHVGVPWVDGRPPADPADRYRIIRYPRPATLAERESGKPFTGGERSPCVFLGRDGCRFRFEERPRMCQSLEPAADGECEGPWDQRSAALAWLPWQGLVAEAVRRAPGRSTPAGGSP
jgi:Fe-S-cluster containining protein